MKDNILEQETDTTNYKKLSAALRQDIRDASSELLIFRAWLLLVRDVCNVPAYMRNFIGISLTHIDDTLAALDCIDHIKPEPDDADEVQS